MIKRKLIWIALGLFSLIIKSLVSGQPELVEQYYSRGFYPVVRLGFNVVTSWIPIPVLYILLTAVGVYIVRGIIGLFRSGKSVKLKIMHSALSIGAFLGGTLFFFFFLWGFNYSRVPIEKQLNLELKPLSAKELREELIWASEKMVKLRNELSVHYSENPYELELPKQTEKQLRIALEDWLKRHDFSTVGKVRGRWLYPKGIFLHFSSAGLYLPFTGEGHIDAGLHVLDQPSTMAHELAHGYGFADEGTCNFLSFVASVESEDLFFAYSAYLSHWIRLANNYHRVAPDDYQKIRDLLSETNLNDIEAIFVYLRKYPDLMPKFRYYAYDAYLKSQGIKEGMLNYNRVVMMVRAWRMAKKS